jgi:hypothetical protein
MRGMSVHNPYSREEVEGRLQELLSQRVRAKQLFHCYAAELEDDEELAGESDDAYLAYYDEAAVDG